MLYENFVVAKKNNYVLLERYIGKETFVKIKKSDEKIVIESSCFSGSTVKFANLEGVSKLNIGSFVNSDIEEVVLSERINEIPRLCFGNCKNLKKINLENITHIVDFAFNGCVSLKEADLKKCNFIGACAFMNCRNTYFKNLENVEFINEMALCGCNTGSITLNKIIAIKEKAFKDAQIFSLKINNECDIEKSAFYGAKIQKLIFSKKPNFYPRALKENVTALKNVCINSEFKDIEYNVPKTVYKETTDILLNKGFTMHQANQIIKAYDKDIYMSEVSIETSTETLRAIRTKYEELPLFYQMIINDKSFKGKK